MFSYYPNNGLYLCRLSYNIQPKIAAIGRVRTNPLGSPQMLVRRMPIMTGSMTNAPKALVLVKMINRPLTISATAIKGNSQTICINASNSLRVSSGISSGTGM